MLMKGLLVLLAFFGAGTVVSKWLHIPLPGNLLGMLLLTACLCFGWVKMETVERVSSFLLRHMLLFFVPILVGAAQYFPLLLQNPWPILVSLVAGPLCVMSVSGVVTQRYLNRKKRTEQDRTTTEGEVLDA
jgi:holin-like protein